MLRKRKENMLACFYDRTAEGWACPISLQKSPPVSQELGAFFMGEWLQKRLNSKATEKALGLVPRAFSIISAGGD